VSEPLITSFVVRVIQTDPADGTFRVTVRHVQSGDERQFSGLHEAADYMNTFVSELLNTQNPPSE